MRRALLGRDRALRRGDGLPPLEGALLERRDVDRTRRVLTVRGTKATGSYRKVPLTGRAPKVAR
jgi:hypothetical protein